MEKSTYSSAATTSCRSAAAPSTASSGCAPAASGSRSQESEVTKRLAGYAALVAVPTMIAGVYGMNFEVMPELNWAFGYPLAVGLMVAIDVYLFYRFRQAKWL